MKQAILPSSDNGAAARLDQAIDIARSGCAHLDVCSETDGFIAVESIDGKETDGLDGQPIPSRAKHFRLIAQKTENLAGCCFSQLPGRIRILITRGVVAGHPSLLAELSEAAKAAGEHAVGLGLKDGENVVSRQAITNAPLGPLSVGQAGNSGRLRTVWNRIAAEP